MNRKGKNKPFIWGILAALMLTVLAVPLGALDRAVPDENLFEAVRTSGPEEIVQGDDGYLYRANPTDGSPEKLLDYKVKTYTESEGALYCIADGDLMVSINKSSGEAVELYQAEEEIAFIQAEGGAVFFVAGDTAYRHVIEDGRTEELITVTGMTHYFPISGHEFVWYEEDKNGEMVWIYSNQEGEMDEYVPLVIAYVYDCLTGETAQFDDEAYFQTLGLMSEEEIWELEQGVGETLARAGGLIAYGTTNLPEYPAGSYFTKNGRVCGTCHGRGICDANGSDCNCRKINGGVQCQAFGWYAYAELANNSKYAAASGDRFGEKIFSSDKDVKNYLQKKPWGTFLRCSKPSGGKHTVILLRTTDTNIYVYEANHDNKCGVGLRNLTYQQFKTTYKSIDYGYSHNFGSAVSYNSTYHSRSCSSSGCSGVTYERHYAHSSNPKRCVECNYSGTIPIVNSIPYQAYRD